MQLVITQEDDYLQEPDDLTTLRVVVGQGVDEADVAMALARAHLTYLDLESERVWVPLEEIQRRASGRVAGDWGQRFERMVAYAADHGWVSEDGRSVRADVTSTGD